MKNSTIRFALFSDAPPQAKVATFGGDRPSWAIVIGPGARIWDTKEVPNGCPALLVLFDRDSADARAVEALFNDMRVRGRVTGIDARQLKGLGDWLAKNGRCAGEPVATLIAAGCDVASVKISTDNQEAA